jgi:type I restriction enzyme R subunit
MTATTFWRADGRQASAAQLVESLFSALAKFFRDEDVLRPLWGMPDTHKRLLAGLADKGFGREPLAEMQKIIEAENTDLFDVLAYVAFATAPSSRETRAAVAKAATDAQYTDKHLAFIEFVLSQYVQQGVDELDPEKLSPLRKLRYRELNDAFELGRPEEVGGMFLGFQKHLYPAASEQDRP